MPKFQGQEEATKASIFFAFWPFLHAELPAVTSSSVSQVVTVRKKQSTFDHALICIFQDKNFLAAVLITQLEFLSTLWNSVI